MTKSRENPLARRVQSLRKALKSKRPEELARCTGVTFSPSSQGEGHYHFPYWYEEVTLSSENYIVRDRATQDPLNVVDQAMIAYYFHDSKISGPARGWISFSELPDGQFYATAFQGYTSKKILATFNARYASFGEASRKIGGRLVSFASQAYQLQILPKVATLLACWKGDRELSPSYQILFQDIVMDHLPTDACAILGSMITSKLIKAQKD